MDAFQGQCWSEAPEFPASLSVLLQTPTLRQDVGDNPQTQKSEETRVIM